MSYYKSHIQILSKLFFSESKKMFGKKKKKQLISSPSNFEHRVHTGFDHQEGKYVGLPPQWQGIVHNALDKVRPMPLVDPMEITPVEIEEMRVRNCPLS